ncbi:MAG TPA: ATP-binding cassette domain-containing protein [Anaerolineales bacterium]|nr:ATP-binding cassette domain-containing protein [Anaerolineales bacterium]
MPVVIEFKDYSWKYLNTQLPALDTINLQIEEGMFVGVIGPNGSGKTTLAYSMNGLIPGQYNGIKNGEVIVYGKEVEQYEHGELQKIAGMVFSDPEAQFTAMTVEDELVFGLENLGMDIPEIRERLAWVTELTGLGKMLLKPPYELSGGQKQRVALAAVLAMTPKILILDEPTTMLDPVSRRRVFDVLAKLKKEQHNTIIVIEHNLENLIPLADRMILLSDNRLIMEDETHAFFQNMELLTKEGIYPPGALRFFYELRKTGYTNNAYPVTLPEASNQLRYLFR